MFYYKINLNVSILLKSVARMREMPSQTHKFQKLSEGGMPPDALVGCVLRRADVPRLGGGIFEFRPGW